MTYPSFSEQSPESGRRFTTADLAKFVAMLTTGAMFLTAMVGITTAGLLYASGIFQ